jgi:RNA polymerase sigma-70 factor, Bacteroides expansion family 1
MKGLHNEKLLLEKVVHGDQAAYKMLFSHYWDQVYAVALLFTKHSQLAEDMTQDVFARIWIKRASLEAIDDFNAWLFITARNLIYDKLRATTFSGAYDEYLVTVCNDTAALPDEQLETKELEVIIHKGIHHLPPQQQTAFKLSRFQGLSHEEIAAQMGISRESVKSYMVRSMASLRKLVKQYAATLHSLF